MKYINETRPAFDNTSKAKCILKLMNMSKNMNECITRLHFSICFQQFRFFFIQFGWALSFNCHIFYVGFVFFIYFLILIIMELFRIIPALLMVTHIHTHTAKCFVVSICAFNSAGTLTLELFPLTCLLHLRLFTQYERHFFPKLSTVFFHAIFFSFLFNVWFSNFCIKSRHLNKPLSKLLDIIIWFFFVREKWWVYTKK